MHSLRHLSNSVFDVSLNSSLVLFSFSHVFHLFHKKGDLLGDISFDGLGNLLFVSCLLSLDIVLSGVHVNSAFFSRLVKVHLLIPETNDVFALRNLFA